MRIRFWRCRSSSVPSAQPRRVPDRRPSWATAPTEVFPTAQPGRAGNPTPAQRWRAGGWRDEPGRRR